MLFASIQRQGAWPRKLKRPKLKRISYTISPRYELKSIELMTVGTEEDCCAICLLELRGADLVLSCGHAIHRECLLCTISGEWNAKLRPASGGQCQPVHVDADAPLAEWRCCSCRAPIDLGAVVRASGLGEHAVGKHYVARKPSGSSAVSPRWAGLHHFLHLVQPCQSPDLESQAQLPDTSCCARLAYAAATALECTVPPLSSVLLSAAATMHVRRLLRPELPSFSHAVASCVCAIGLLWAYLALGCLALQHFMLAVASALCCLLPAMSTWLLDANSVCIAERPPLWSALLMWVLTGGLALWEAGRRGLRIFPLLLEVDLNFLRLTAAWTGVCFAFAVWSLLMKLAVDVLTVFVFLPLLNSTSAPVTAQYEFHYGGSIYN